MEKKPSLLKVFLYFLKVGLFTIGGGYAMIAMLEKELVDKNHWITHEDMLNIIVIGESTPGPIAVNLATFIGYKMHGFWGSFFCTLGFVIPSFTIITIISVCLKLFENVPNWVLWFFSGLRAGVVILIGSACVKFFKRMDKNFFSFLMLFMGFFVSFFTDLSVIYLILIGGVLGLVYSYAVTRYTKKKNPSLSPENNKFTGRNSDFTGKISKNKLNDNIISEAKTNESLQENGLKNSEYVSENNDENLSENACENEAQKSEDFGEKAEEKTDIINMKNDANISENTSNSVSENEAKNSENKEGDL